MAMQTGHLLPPQLGAPPGARRLDSPRRGSPRRGSPGHSPPARIGEPESRLKADLSLPSLARRIEAPKKMIDPPAAVELRPPTRELGVVGTADVLRRFRRDHGLFAELSLAELEDLAELISPLGFRRGEILFLRGEPASWMGFLMAGRAQASLPQVTGSELRLGNHQAGEIVGSARVALWERSHARPYTLRALEDGCIAVLSFDQLEALRRSRPAFHHSLLRVLLMQLADSSGCFFRGCPVSKRLKWNLAAFTERRVLDFLVRLRDEGKLLPCADYHSLLALACRLRVAQWQPRVSVLARGEPLEGALIVLDGKFTGFRDAGSSPSMWFDPGDIVGLEYLLGGVQPCPLDVFAARPTLAALLLPSDLEDLRREYPSLATEILQGLYSKLFSELATTHPEPLLLVAEASDKVQFQPSESPIIAPAPLRFAGNLSPEDLQTACKLAETTAPIPRGVHPSARVTSAFSDVVEGSALRDDAAIRRYLSDPHGLTASWAEQEPTKAQWLLGSFLTQKLMESHGGPEGRAKAREATVEAVLRASGPGSPPGSPTRQPAVPASDGRQHPLAALGGFEGFGAAVESRLGLSPGRSSRHRPESSPTSRVPLKEAGLKSVDREKASRPSSAPPGRAVGRSQWLIKFPGAPGAGPGAEVGKMDLWSNPPPFFSCPFCSRRVQVPKSIWPSDPGVMVRTGPRRGKGPEYDGGFHPEKRKIARVVSSTYRHGNRADFYLDGKKIALDSGRWAFHEQNRRGFNIVTLDPDSQQILSAMSYDTASGGNVAVSQLATDLNSLPEGRIVLVAVRGSGLQSLSGAAIRALRRVGATSMVSGGRSQEGYVLIGMKGGDAVAERRGHHVEVEGVLPRPPWQPETATTADPSYAPTVEKLRLRQLLRSVVLVASGFFRDKSSRLVAWSLACALLVMMLGFSLLQMWFLNTFREFQNALHDKDQQKFYSTLLLMFKVVLSIMPLLALRELLRGALALEWRRYLTSSLLSRYIGESRMYYRLKLLGKGLDNPDQRIAQDCGEFTDAILQFLALLVQNIMLILFQSSLLFKISPDLFYFVVVYSIVLNVLTFVVFGGPLTRLRRRILAQEASFRFGLVRVREHAESIAFYGGESFERGRCQDRFFSSLMDTLYRMLGVTVSFSIILAAATYVVRVAPFAVLAGKYFKGDIDFGAMMEAFSILSGLEDAFTTLVSQMSSITDMGAQAIRIQQIWDLVSDDSKGLADRPAITMERDADSIKESQEVPVLLQMQEVTLQTPSGHAVLVERLSFQLRQGESLLLCGRSGVGKSSLLRSIAGLWGRGTGVIRCCPQRETFFLPQETYLCLGTLRENATYPQEAGGADPRDDAIREVLVKVNLDYLHDRYGLDKPVDFDAVLSGGERQRLGFARLLLRPNLKFAILDEATSALDRSNQSAMYENLQRHVQGFVSIGHSSSLEVFHTQKLVLERSSEGAAGWRLESIR
eukprot:s364_g11.t1